jgi:hypothetical protein
MSPKFLWKPSPFIAYTHHPKKYSTLSSYMQNDENLVILKDSNKNNSHLSASLSKILQCPNRHTEFASAFAGGSS